MVQFISPRPQLNNFSRATVPLMLFRFCRADLVQYEKLSKSNAIYNLNHAFNMAEKEFGLVKLLDAGGSPVAGYLVVDKLVGSVLTS